VTAAGIFIWGKGQWGPGPKAPVGGMGDEVPQKLKQFADIVYIFRPQKPSKFENFTLFTS